MGRDHCASAGASGARAVTGAGAGTDGEVVCHSGWYGDRRLGSGAGTAGVLRATATATATTARTRAIQTVVQRVMLSITLSILRPSIWPLVQVVLQVVGFRVSTLAGSTFQAVCVVLWLFPAIVLFFTRGALSAHQ